MGGIDEVIGSFGYGAVVLVLCVVVFVHELGHYLVARWCGVRVETFSIGFGKELFGWTDRHGTRWKFSLLPLGGYVKMFGEHSLPNENGGPAEMTQEQKAVSFSHKTLAQRSAVVAAGPMANFVFAIFVYAVMLATVGEPKQQDFLEAGIGGVVEDSAAAEAGFQPGDRFLMIDDADIAAFSDLRDAVTQSEGRELQVTVDRDGAVMRIPVTPREVVVDQPDGTSVSVYQLGVRGPGPVYEPVNAIEIIWKAPAQTWQRTEEILVSLGELVIGNRSTDELGGPILIAVMSNEFAQYGFVALVLFTAFISINLGLINLFPIPVLDGGHLLFYAIEAVRGKPLGERAQEYSLRIGLALLLSLMIFVTVNDLIRLTL